jgi:hypothetical protein
MIEPTAIAVPVRAADGLALSITVPVDTTRIVRVHVIFVDILFTNNE